MLLSHAFTVLQTHYYSALTNTSLHYVMCYGPTNVRNYAVAVVVVCLYRDECELYGTRLCTHTSDIQHERHSIVHSIEFLACA
jgi:hypothetical protein